MTLPVPSDNAADRQVKRDNPQGYIEGEPRKLPKGCERDKITIPL